MTKQKSKPQMKEKIVIRSIPAKPKNKANTTLGRLGGKLGSYFGPLGSNVGSTAGDFISKITGWGDYKVNSNTLSAGNSVPSFRKDGDGVRICHREFIQDIKGSLDFSNQSFNINPGLDTTFPWLSEVAQNFEEYKLNGLVFEYRPTSGSAVSSTSSALGVVVYATAYDALDPNFINKQMMESYEFSSSTVPFTTMLHPVECAPFSAPNVRYFVRDAGATPADLLLYDYGKFQVATAGMQSVYTVGELWVSYDVTFTKPRIQQNSNAQLAHIRATPMASATQAAPFGTTGAVLDPDSTLTGIAVSTAAPTTSFVIKKQGNYIITYSWTGSSIGAIPSPTTGSNITGYAYFSNNTLNAIGTFTGSVTVMTTYISVLHPGDGAANTITIGGLTGLTGGNADVTIALAPNRQ